MQKPVLFSVLLFLNFFVQTGKAQTLQWVDGWNEKNHSDWTSGNVCCSDEHGNIYVVYLQGLAENSPVVVKYLPNGKFVWERRFFFGDGALFGIVADKQGNLFIAGHFGKDLLVDGIQGPLFESSGAEDMFIIKMAAATGGIDEGIVMGNDNFDEIHGIAIDKFDNIYVTGGFSSIVNFDPMNGPDAKKIEATGPIDMFVAKYDNNLSLQWVQHAGDYFDYATGVTLAVNDVGDLYVGGHFLHELTFPDHELNSAGKTDIFIAYYKAADGQFLWSRSIGGTDDETIRSMASDNNGNFYICGTFMSPDVNMDVNTNAKFMIKNIAGEDAYWAKYDRDRNLNWAYSAGGTLRDVCDDIKVNDKGEVYISGAFHSDHLSESQFNFQLQNTNTDGSRDAFLGKYDEQGKFVWMRTLAGRANETIQSLSLDMADDIIITGGYQYTVDFDLLSGQNIQQTSPYTSFFLAKYRDGVGSSGERISGEALLNSTESNIASLDQNFPNPVTSVTTINYSLSKDAQVKIDLYNISGKPVTNIFSGFRQAGKYSVQFNKKALTPGVYIYRMTAGNQQFSRRMVVE